MRPCRRAALRLRATAALARVIGCLLCCAMLAVASAAVGRAQAGAGGTDEPRRTGEDAPATSVADAGADSVVCGGVGELEIARLGIRQAGESLVADLVVAHLLTDESVALLRDGVPSTIAINVELWRSRGIWFDAFLSSRSLIFRLQYDLWAEAFEIVTIADGKHPERIYATIEEAHRLLCDHQGVAIADFEVLEPDREYYVVATAAVKPMTLEDVVELESWLSGELSQRRGGGFGILGLPKQLFGVILSLTGLRDQNASARTERFDRTIARRGRSLALR